ncbi:armadillo-type protein [Armillaria borealis]|uniref:Armadillo-type protein n=1 Tax=Armillaria borealis TaxID=47425 RepID=A0AA39JRK6_9AGAR|nr:armadillo-type protein [Armillaria borealis]
MSTWTPHPVVLEKILHIMYESAYLDLAQSVQQNITQKLNDAPLPGCIAYLAHILCWMREEKERIRSIAGYLLKNNSSLILTCAPEVAAYVKNSVLQALCDSSVVIRNTAGQNIVAFLGVLEPKNWLQCLHNLMGMLDMPDLDKQEAAFNVLENACENYPKKMDFEINGTRLLDYMIPKFLSLADHQSSKMRSHAIACLSYFVPTNCQSLFIHLDAFIACLFRRASDDDPSVRCHVCQALVLLLAARPERLMPEMNNVVEYMLYSIKDQNKNVALGACQFWLTFAEDVELPMYLHPLLAKVAPVLLDCMIYSKDELLWLDRDAEDEAVPDKLETDIKRRHFGSKSHGLEWDANGEPPKAWIGAYGEEMYDDDDDDDGFNHADDMSTEWNLRKCAAAALDVLAVQFTGDLLNVLLGPLKDKLWSSDWLQIESGILALGAMAKGWIDAIEPHLPTLVPYLINMLNDPKPLVRSITCWTLGRYASWTTQPISEEHKAQYFIPTMEGLLQMVLNSNKRVQEAGCGAFATVEEKAGREMAPYIEPILKNLVFAFDKYQHKNILILYDVVGTLADAVGPALSSPFYIEIIMPPLMNRWSKLKNNDPDLIPLLECLQSITIATGMSFHPYAGPVFERCKNIIHHVLLQYQAFQQNPEVDEPDKSFLVVALDLLSGLTQGLGMSLEELINQTQPPLLSLLTVCLNHSQAHVRQSAYALVGDMVIRCFCVLRPHIPSIMGKLILQLDPEPKFEFIGALNNATWSVGEVALRYGQKFEQWVDPLISRLVPILLDPKAPRSLHENAAVAIGRIGLMLLTVVAPRLAEFVQASCQVLYEMQDSEETDSAIRGLCTMVKVNPAGIAKNAPSPELNYHDDGGSAAQVAVFPSILEE